MPNKFNPFTKPTRSYKRKPPVSIAEDTEIGVHEIASGIIRELELGFDSPIPDRPIEKYRLHGKWLIITTRQELEDALVNFAERVYQNNLVTQRRLRSP